MRAHNSRLSKCIQKIIDVSMVGGYWGLTCIWLACCQAEGTQHVDQQPEKKWPTQYHKGYEQSVMDVTSHPLIPVRHRPAYLGLSKFHTISDIEPTQMYKTICYICPAACARVPSLSTMSLPSHIPHPPVRHRHHTWHPT
jgi:hypothetical protein